MSDLTELKPDELIGKTFERNGQRRVVTRVETYGVPAGDVYWKRSGGKERKRPVWYPYFQDWLLGAVEITEEEC